MNVIIQNTTVVVQQQPTATVVMNKSFRDIPVAVTDSNGVQVIMFSSSVYVCA